MSWPYWWFKIMVEIPLDLSSHCIHTEIKRLYNRTLSECLGNPDIDDFAEERLELLKHALELFDFPALRAKYRELAGGTDSAVALLTDDAGRIIIKMDGTVIEPTCS
ncbi:MAG: hypothetical protein B5M56_00410 [Desulfococcus sp. 4484_241]|nr:MAG: hypothetical protein B5M56_00410 [Desulfococcus sp. 4484_241]